LAIYDFKLRRNNGKVVPLTKAAFHVSEKMFLGSIASFWRKLNLRNSAIAE
jgi:hypothetical protein